MQIFYWKRSFALECGEVLEGFKLAYQTYGILNENKTNVKWVFHALTANTQVHEWWSGVFGSGKLLDPETDFIICVNMPGSCYGSIHAFDSNSANGKAYYYDFPLITIRDMVRMYGLLKQRLEIDQIALAIGGSMGGMQALEFAIAYPEKVQKLVLIACGAYLTPWAKAWNSAQRMAIENDHTWGMCKEDAGIKGLKAARAMAMISYRNYDAFNIVQADLSDTKLCGYRAESYLQHQGEKLTMRFDAFAYYSLTRSMDTHQVGRNHSNSEEALRKIKARTLVIAIESDILFPVKEQQYLASHIAHAQCVCIDSPYGHDGFLIESQQLNRAYQIFINQLTPTTT